MPEPWQPGLCSVTLRDHPAEVVIDIAAGAGLTAIEWGADRHAPPGDHRLAARLAAATTAAGLTTASYGSYLFAPRATDRAVEEVMDTALALGAPHVRVWTDRVGPDPDPAVRVAIVSQLVAVAEAAADRALAVSLEFHPGTLTETAAATLALLDEVGAPNLFTYWQPPTGLPVAELLASWHEVQARVSHLHVFRWHSYEDRQPLAEGADLWPGVLGPPPVEVRWSAPRVAFLEFVRGDEPAQVVADAAVLRGWLTG